MVELSGLWTDEERALLDAMLNCLIPANPERRIPAAGDLGVADFLAQRLRREVELGSAIKTLLNGAPAHADAMTPQAVTALENEFPAEFRALLSVTYMGYYSRPDIRALVGVGSHPVHPEGYEVESESEALLDGLTAPVRERGRNYRDTGPIRKS
ncbi:MAG: hypothetical protein OXF74_15035 [Rhodobacteraceae bacterium]|nr:hypothetical protein [Paracoccaceae bacterium]